mmetsp:Transcript_6445/g.14099  ORF Transcript_6445/g.14099 Transcript_6445/m.14099 type:complete len:142 (+) Transcript_6445:84-509(+)|eukprot:CAMPEP_0178451954 /NCGR_PEP_ID=MMETSP0689_2-20121128/43971_1 /TAXON_ID=160604 /ORGANISM="Amphidinium massartii, Strain CS-259" /LENGTH=141 /DNA_ID=CAMNT_0020077597 /DNA_START=84 /DNA_END=509 /DNA_ORIENTATION=-
MAEVDEEVAPAAAVEEEETVDSLEGACRKVLKNALAVDGALRGLHEVAKAIEAEKVKLCFLAESCNEPTYKKLVQGLCLEKNIQLVDVADNKTLGEWAGLCKIDNDGQPRKVVGASVVAITDFGEEGQAHSYLMDYLGKSS